MNKKRNIVLLIIEIVLVFCEFFLFQYISQTTGIGLTNTWLAWIGIVTIMTTVLWSLWTVGTLVKHKTVLGGKIVHILVMVFFGGWLLIAVILLIILLMNGGQIPLK